MQNYKNLKVWQDGHKLVLSIYRITNKFPSEERFGVTSQLKRAAFSIPANIAEGAGRKGQNDFAQFLNISLGSLNETDYFLVLCKDLNYLDIETYESLNYDLNRVRAQLISLIRKVRT